MASAFSVAKGLFYYGCCFSSEGVVDGVASTSHLCFLVDCEILVAKTSMYVGIFRRGKGLHLSSK